MSIEEDLMPGERIVYRTRIHLLPFLRPLAGFLLALMFFAGGWWLRVSWFYALGGLLVAFAGVAGIVSLFEWRSAVCVITSRRVIYERGVLRHRSDEIMLNQIESVRLIQPIGAALLGYGFVDVRGTGGKVVRLDYVERPKEFRNRVQKILASMNK